MCQFSAFQRKASFGVHVAGYSDGHRGAVIGIDCEDAAVGLHMADFEDAYALGQMIMQAAREAAASGERADAERPAVARLPRKVNHAAEAHPFEELGVSHAG